MERREWPGENRGCILLYDSAVLMDGICPPKSKKLGRVGSWVQRGGDVLACRLEGQGCQCLDPSWPFGCCVPTQLKDLMPLFCKMKTRML